MTLPDAAVALLTVAAMEIVAWAVHKHVMHGRLGWRWHASHHAPRAGAFELNDLYGLLAAALATALIWIGNHGAWPLQWVGTGMTLYGLLYFVAHDGLVHQRWPWRWTPRHGYLKHLVQAHRLHHAVHAREGAVSFGFLWAPPVQKLRAQLKARRQQESGAA